MNSRTGILIHHNPAVDWLRRMILFFLLCLLLPIFHAAFSAEAATTSTVDKSGDMEKEDETDYENTLAVPLSEVEEEQTIATALASRSVTRLAYQAERMIARSEFDEAQAVIEYGLGIDSSYIPLWRLLGAVYIETDQPEEAQKALAVCLLLNPRDPDARVLSLVNELRRDGLTERERINRLVGDINSMDTDLFSRVVTRFAERQDFREHLSAILQYWRRHDVPLAGIKDALRLYAGGHARQAADTIHAIHKSPLTASIIPIMQTLVSEGLAPESTSEWKTEQGTVTRDGNTITLGTGQKTQAFSWLRLSPDWSDVEATISFSDIADARKALYLRFTSPESYLRLTTKNAMLIVQERIADVGLSTIFEHPLSELETHPIEIILRGNRLLLRVKNEVLTEPPLPISDAIVSGRVALGLESTTPETTVQFHNFSARKIESDWRHLPVDASQPVLARFLENDMLTGVILEADGFSTRRQRALSGILIDASGQGLKIVGALPSGELDIKVLQQSVSHLPKILAERIWTAAAFRPGNSSDWKKVAEALEQTRQAGMESVLILNNQTAASLAEFTGELWTDWLCLESDTALPEKVRNALALRFAHELERDAADPHLYHP